MRRKHLGLVTLLAVIAVLTTSIGFAATPTPEAASPTEGVTPEIDNALVPEHVPTSERTTAAGPNVKRYGMVAGRVDDRGFNATSWGGMLLAAGQLGVNVNLLHGFDPATIRASIMQLVNLGYDGIITVGSDMADATRLESTENPDLPFAIVDVPSQAPGTMGLLFDVDEPSFMAGYLAAGMSENATVCTYGGIQIPPVMAFMAGFENGVAYYNTQKGADVKVLGWKSDAQNPIGGAGEFVGDWESIDKAGDLTEKLADAGCDIVFPVAGGAGLGSLPIAKERAMLVIGVDADQALTNPDYADLYLTSVVKRTDLVVLETIRQMQEGTFAGGSNFVGKLANGAVDLAPFHEFEDKVPQEMKDELAAIRQGLTEGTIPTGWPIFGVLKPASLKK